MDWVFQCNPKRYDLASELEKGNQTEDWSMNQHRELVSPGDRVFFWQTGSNARLLARRLRRTTPRGTMCPASAYPIRRGSTHATCPRRAFLSVMPSGH